MSISLNLQGLWGNLSAEGGNHLRSLNSVTKRKKGANIDSLMNLNMSLKDVFCDQLSSVCLLETWTLGPLPKTNKTISVKVERTWGTNRDRVLFPHWHWVESSLHWIYQVLVSKRTESPCFTLTQVHICFMHPAEVFCLLWNKCRIVRLSPSPWRPLSPWTPYTWSNDGLFMFVWSLTGIQV